MLKRASRRPANGGRRRSPKLAFLVFGAAATLFLALGGSSVAAKGLITARDIATGAVTGKTIRNGTITPKDLNSKTKRSLAGRAGLPGAAGASGSNGAAGPNGANGANGPNGADGLDGADGADGTNGADGADGADGVLGPLSATTALTALPTATPPTVVVTLAVPAGNYVVLAKTQLSHTGASDTVDCSLKAGALVVDQVSMKTLPALASIPASLQAVTTTSPTQLSLECDVLTANGSASFSSLIAIPTT